MGSYCPTTGRIPNSLDIAFETKTEGDCFASDGRLCQSFALRYENDFWPFLKFSLEISNQ